jgi:hypothetical protein
VALYGVSACSSSFDGVSGCCSLCGVITMCT